MTLRVGLHLIQLLDNSTFHVGGPGGTPHLPVADKRGTYDADCNFTIADKVSVRDIMSKLNLHEGLPFCEQGIKVPCAVSNYDDGYQCEAEWLAGERCGGLIEAGALLPLLYLKSTKKSPISLRKSSPLRPSSPTQQGKVNLLLLLQKKNS
jgi:hypothetical protein